MKHQIIILLLLGQISCLLPIEKQNNNTMFGLFKKDYRIRIFGPWFSENEKTYRNFQDNSDKCLNELLVESEKQFNGLAIELELPKDEQ